MSISLPTTITPLGIGELYDKVIRAGNIQDVMAISNFLNPEEEKDIQDGMEESGPEEVLNEVLEEHLGQGSTQDDDKEEEQLEQPVFTIQSACQALQVLIGFAAGQDALKAEHL
ncbi:hypothetical protein VC83_08718 [Pseudogymnoascus destructans]|uniref:Uncharacterized protein n=2 Tax=Pseudogymnoascus destructans TaxID=655981 RepID=L8G8I6_PSED2|nr:uncharacterized protein VC83_08718 [Pseudogymnoascus destructans]ELR09545.1 hypothetical protein GMDG_04040 [Pseudogymnoascus destructans 20631-21]OAF55092.1 hypothetical protein VC83_08718 [Pseudogymnoascus destructans]